MAIVNKEMIIEFLKENGGQMFYDDLIKAVFGTGFGRELNAKHITEGVIADMHAKAIILSSESNGEKIVILR